MPDDEYSTYARLYSQLSLDKLAELDQIGLHLNSLEPAIICKQCGYAITADKDRVCRHLGEIHKVDKAARRGLNKLIRLLNLPDLKNLCLRPDSSAPYPHLKSLIGASSCKHCATEWGFPHSILESVEKAVKGSLGVIDSATRETASGKFISYKGQELPW
ncbi:hypothetical protein IWW34DRAFT_754667 [Fusarium oxysporum f. sp. albedinis]|jgi:hypothetical protein|nr:hypothetical protein IWW34DRAFT_754667 [Fusarium oxysporum f. sp. albedinis]KAJ0132272.1 Uncharacterized protein HZ326_24653 [Fusarium oxysporum f. sp. albedinis]